MPRTPPPRANVHDEMLAAIQAKAQAWYDANAMGAPMNIPVEVLSAGEEQSWPVGARKTGSTARPRVVSKPKDAPPVAKSRSCRFKPLLRVDDPLVAIGTTRWRSLPRG